MKECMEDLFDPEEFEIDFAVAVTMFEHRDMSYTDARKLVMAERKEDQEWEKQMTAYADQAQLPADET